MSDNQFTTAQPQENAVQVTKEQPMLLPAEDEDSNNISLAGYAQRAYLEYALSVVKGRALPTVSDGQKPVQRRILYAMERLGLSYKGKAGAKPVKSSRVVGDVLGRYHPHGDQAAYEALVRMAQDFSQRYPLIDGQGNFGSRDGDSAAAMRYTEARLSPYSQLLLDEIDNGTVSFSPNYDGTIEEPNVLPARLPFMLLNGASGIAVGLSTEIPSHNLAEVARACVALLKNAQLSDEELLQLIPGPDFPSGAQIINSTQEIAQIYQTGRGSLKVRARWHIEDLARSQWQLVIDELPPNVSAQKVLEEIEEISNPKPKAGKKSITPEQITLKNTILSVLDAVRDESGQNAAVRLVIEPKTSRTSQENLIAVLLVHTSLEASVSVNLTCIGIDGVPMQKSLRSIISEWNQFREATVLKRNQYQLRKIQERIHILEGRQLVLLNIDEVIALIRNSDEPKMELMQRFLLTERQAEDILDIRLRQLAKLEAIKIEQELANLSKEQQSLQAKIDNPNLLRRQVISEIQQDCKQYADARRTVIAMQKRASFTMPVQDEAVTVIVSQKGWVRVRQGHNIDNSTLKFKVGDALYATFECRSVDNLIAFSLKGRVYSVAVSSLPDSRGDGQPISALIEVSNGDRIQYYVAGNMQQTVLLSGSSGYGFLVTIKYLLCKQKAGKEFVALNADETLCPPSLLRYAAAENETAPQLITNKIACLSAKGRLLTFDANSLKYLKNGGRGLMLLSLEANDAMLGAVAYQRSVIISGVGRGNKERSETLEVRSLNNAFAARARKGREVKFSFKLQSIVAKV